MMLELSEEDKKQSKRLHLKRIHTHSTESNLAYADYAHRGGNKTCDQGS